MIAPYTRTDEDIRTGIIRELRREPSIDSSTIGVAVDDGIVTLTGHVSTFGQKRVAESAAQRVKGVRAIAEEIEVRLTTAHKRDDADVAAAAVSALRWNSWVPKDSIQVTVEKGWLTLSGNVHWGYEKREAESAVRDLYGVLGVINKIKLQPKAEPTNIKKEIGETLRKSAEQDANKIIVEMKDGVVNLRGTVRSWVEREDAERAAYASPGVSDVRNFITISA